MPHSNHSETIHREKSHFNRRGILSWPSLERPRERLLRQGASVLSDAELLGVLLRNGTRGKDAVMLARELLAQTQGFRGLFAMGIPELLNLQGLGEAKVAGLLAAMEISRRHLREEIIGKSILSNPETVLNYLYRSLRDKKKEIFKVLFLNKAAEILDEIDFFEGTLDRIAVYPREILKAALARNATGLILVHNHPSGKVDPSIEDKKLTRDLESVCRNLSLEVLDHIIVGNNIYFSFHEHSLMGGQKEEV